MGAHAAPPLEIGEAELLALRAIVRAGTSEQRAVTRARIVLLAAEGVANTRIAKQVGVSLPTRVQQLMVTSGKADACLSRVSSALS
ncbi:MAG: hypothetical protein H0U74_19140 [Bradymonadaceae bacterium]|nr:hypothetical protein [Lujinxingiaceae bacterium]